MVNSGLALHQMTNIAVPRFLRILTTLTLFIFCRSWISVSWRAAKQRLKQQIKETESRLTKLWSQRNHDKCSGSERFSGRGGDPVGKAQIWNALSKASLLFLRWDETGRQPIYSLDQRNLLRFVQLPTQWYEQKGGGGTTITGTNALSQCLEQKLEKALILLERSK